MRGGGGGDVHAGVAEVGAGVGDCAHAKIVLGERKEDGHSRIRGGGKAYSD